MLQGGQKIDADLKPQSKELAGWSASGEANIIRKEAEVKNVIAVLEGEGPLANETVVIGAHYDHLGNVCGDVSPADNICNGATDNATGVAAALAVGRSIAAGPQPRRSVVIALWDAEEDSLAGSAAYLASPAVPGAVHYFEGATEVLATIPGVRIEDPKACRCGEVLTGQIKPWECGVFGTACTPERPLGTCMVSSEGACAAYYAYGRHRAKTPA